MPNARDVRLSLLFFAMGFAAMAAQIIVLRQIITVFGGNELTAGAVFAGWLGFSGLGNLTSGRFADRITDVELSAAISILLLSIAIPLTSALAFLIKAVMGLPPPIVTGLVATTIAVMTLLAPMCMLVGASFTFSCRLPNLKGAGNIGLVYLVDALGAGIGGALFSIFAIRHFSALQSALIIAGILTLAVNFAFRRISLKMTFLSLMAVLTVTLLFSPRLESFLTSVQWKGYNTAAKRESLFASLMVTANRNERTLFVDGRPSFSLPLPEDYEAISHVPLLEHDDPKDAAIIGGGLSGVIEEYKKWALNSAYFVRQDPDETLLEERAMLGRPIDAPEWAHILHMDGRLFVRGARDLDVITVNIGDPDTAAVSRYFTKEFFEEAARALKYSGVLCITALEPSNVMGFESLKLAGTIYHSLSAVFGNVVVLPLDRFYFVASKGGGLRASYPDELIARLDARKLKTDYLKAWVLEGISRERTDFFARSIKDAAASSQTSTDTHPLAYLEGIRYSESKAAGFGHGILSRLDKFRSWMGLVVVAIGAVLSTFIGRRSPKKASVVCVLFALGFASITYQITLLVHYQMTMGILVWKIGLLLTAFMVGASVGTLLCLSLRGALATRQSRVLLLSILLLACYMPLMFVVTGVSFLFASFMSGLLSGWVYQLSANCLVSSGVKIGASAGMIEGSDHFGAAVGAVLASIAIIPLFGCMWSLLTAGALLLAAFVVAAILFHSSSPNTIA